MATVSVEKRPKIEVSNLEISLIEINMGEGIIEFLPENKSGQKRFSFSSTEGEDRMLDETFDLSKYSLTKVKSGAAIWLTPHNKDQKSICITFKSRDSYELFLSHSSEKGGPRKGKKSTQSFKHARTKDRIAKREADTVYEDHFFEEEIKERDLELIKREDVKIHPAYPICTNVQDNTDKRPTSGSDVDGEGEENKEKREPSSVSGPLRSDDDISNSDSDTKSDEIENEDENEILQKAAHSAKDRRPRISKRDQSTQSPLHMESDNEGVR